MPPVAMAAGPMSSAMKPVPEESGKVTVPSTEKYNVILDVKYDSFNVKQTNHRSFHTRTTLGLNETVMLGGMKQDSRLDSKDGPQIIKEEDTITFTIYSVNDGILKGYLNIHHQEDGKVVSSTGLELSAPFGYKKSAHFSAREGDVPAGKPQTSIDRIDVSILPTVSIP